MPELWFCTFGALGKKLATLAMKSQALVKGLCRFKGDFPEISERYAEAVAEIDDAFGLVCESLSTEFVLTSIVHFAAIRPLKDGSATLKQSIDPEMRAIQEVDHGGEKAAQRDAELLQEQADHDWAESVHNFIQQDSQEGADEEEDIFVHTFSRTPQEFTRALLEGKDLRGAREALSNHGYACVLQSGAKVFVLPEQYSLVMQALEQSDTILQPSCVIVTESLIPELEASLASIASRKNVRVKTTQTLQMPINLGGQGTLAAEGLDASGEVPTYTTSDGLTSEHIAHIPESSNEIWLDLEVQRTFLCTVKSKREPSSVNQSTTEVHGGVNPRRLVVA